jgi:excinuclease ABC subunit C
MSVVPRSLVCVDISHNQGRDTVGSLVWFEAGRPRKSEYRKFKIQGLGQQDDFAAIQEVLTRYLTRRRDEQLPMPDLIVIDGGKGQLNAALEVTGSLGLGGIPMVSLAKREEEVFLPGQSESLRLSRRSPSLRLLQRARDEAHRFGLAYNRKRRTQRTITSELLNIPGVGPTRRRLLLERFGSLAGVKSASVSELATVPGFSTRLAEQVLSHLHAAT